MGCCDGKTNNKGVDIKLPGTNDVERTYKVCFLGESAVGKSTLVGRLMGYAFDETYTITIGADYHTRKKVINGQPFKFQIWDTAGQERFRSLVPSYLNSANAIVLVYDVTVRETFDSIGSVWLDFMKNCLRNVVQVLLIGNKTDIVAADKLKPPTEKKGIKAVKDREAKQLCKTNGWTFQKMSAKTSTGPGITKIFDDFLYQLIFEDRGVSINSVTDIKPKEKSESSDSSSSIEG